MANAIITIREDYDGYSWITVLDAPTRRALTELVRERNWTRDTGCGADCTGLVCASSCALLRAYRLNDGTWKGVVACSEARDV